VSRVFWDTNLFIYLLEGSGPQSARVTEIRKRMLERDDELCTSTLTLGEVLVKPAERGNEALRQRYEDVLAQTARLIAFDRETPADTRRSDATEASGRRMPSSLPARLRSGWTSSSPMTIASAASPSPASSFWYRSSTRFSRWTLPQEVEAPATRIRSYTFRAMQAGARVIRWSPRRHH